MLSGELPRAPLSVADTSELRPTWCVCVCVFVCIIVKVTNIGDIGEWLVAPPGNICEFGQEFRPVPLSIQVLSGGRYTNEFAFDKGECVLFRNTPFYAKECQGNDWWLSGLNFKIPDLIRQHSSGRPVLVFCATRCQLLAHPQQQKNSFLVTLSSLSLT